MTDIWQSAYEGENGATMESKIDDAYDEYLNVNGKYYGVPWADGFMGIVRNKNVWDTLGLTEEDRGHTRVFDISELILYLKYEKVYVSDEI